MSRLIRDFRYAARSLLRSPGFTIAAVATLAIGIASNTALFSIVDSLLWKPYPWADADHLVVVQSADETFGIRWTNMSFPDARDFDEQSELLEGLASWDSRMRSSLVVAEVALSLVLVAGAGLTVQAARV